MPVQLSIDVRFGLNLPRTSQVQAELARAMEKSVEAVRRRAVANLSGRFLKVRTGKGVGSVRTKVTVKNDEVIGTIGSPAFYLRILHTGFAGGVFTIQQRGRLFRWERAAGMTLEGINAKKAFTFFGPGGNLIRTQSIKHPGVSARPWLQTAGEESLDDILNAFDQAANNVGRFIIGDGQRAA